MNSNQNSSYMMVVRADKYLADNNAKLNTAAQALVPGIAASIAEIDALRKRQAGGSGRLAGGIAERRLIAKKLRRKLRDIAQTARVLAKGPSPGLDQELHVPESRSYSALLGAGDSFVDTLTPTAIKTAYTARGYAATFVDDLAAVVAQFRSATDRKYGGLNEQLGSTGGLIAAVRSAVAKVRDLDAILSPLLRDDDPEAYTSWKAAIHIGALRTRQRKKSVKKSAAVALAAPVSGGEAATTSDPSTTTAPGSSSGEPTAATSAAQTEAPLHATA